MIKDNGHGGNDDHDDNDQKMMVIMMIIIYQVLILVTEVQVCGSILHLQNYRCSCL